MRIKKEAGILAARLFLASMIITGIVIVLRIVTVDEASFQRDWPKYLSGFGILFFGSLIAVWTASWLERKLGKRK